MLRSMGAGPGMVFGLLVTEAVILAGTAAVTGVAAIHAGMFAARPFVLERFRALPRAGPPRLVRRHRGGRGHGRRRSDRSIACLGARTGSRLPTGLSIRT